MPLFRCLALAALTLPFLSAQYPDCTYSHTFSATANGNAIGNLSGPSGPACNSWILSYTANGFTALNVHLQGARDVNGTAGTFADIGAGSIVLGTNPMTSATNDFLVARAYFSWIRVTLDTTTGSGTVAVKLIGFRGAVPYPVTATTTPSGTQNVNIVSPLGQALMAASIPVVVASNQTTLPANLAQVAGTTTVTGGLAGTQGIGGPSAAGSAFTGNPVPVGYLNSAGSAIIPEYCTSSAKVSTTSSGSTQVVAVSSTTTIRVCKWSWTSDTAVNVKLVTGTGSTCTSSADETGLYTGAGGGIFGVIEDYPTGALVTTAAKTLCINLSGAVTTGAITMLYSQR